jgi:hypothetical protein
LLDVPEVISDFFQLDYYSFFGFVKKNLSFVIPNLLHREGDPEM